MDLNETDEEFLSYQKPLRNRQTADNLMKVFCFTVFNFAFAFIAFKNSDARSIIVLSITLVLAIVGSAVLVACGWSYYVAKIHSVSITRAGITYDKRFWPWSSVVSIQARPVQHKRHASLDVLVNQGFWRSQLLLTIESPEIAEGDLVFRLREFLATEGFQISWQ